MVGTLKYPHAFIHSRSSLLTLCSELSVIGKRREQPPSRPYTRAATGGTRGAVAVLRSRTRKPGIGTVSGFLLFVGMSGSQVGFCWRRRGTILITVNLTDGEGTREEGTMRKIILVAAIAAICSPAAAQQKPAAKDANTPAVNTPNTPPNPGRSGSWR